MAYARITRARLHSFGYRDAEETVRELISFYMTQEGCLFQGSSGVAPDGTLVKVSLWRSKKDADAAASTLFSLALRGKLIELCMEHPKEEAYELSGGFRTAASVA